MTDFKNRKETFDISRDNIKKTPNDSSKIKAEVERLAEKGTMTPHDIQELYRKFGDDEKIVSEILHERSKRFNKIKRQAKRVAGKIYKKFKDGSKPFHEILDRMMRYKIEHGWTEVEFDEFRKELTYRLTGNRALELDYNPNLPAFRSRINRALGNNRVVVDEGLKIKDSEHGILATILQKYEETSLLHRSVFMHSLMYEDCSLVAMTGEYKRDKHIASNYIHPIIACCFLPKFELFETHMLYSNFGSIVKCCHEKTPIVTEPDSLLFYDITSDPNDVVCEINSPITDLRNRYKVQIGLWETVLKLRNGNYYEASPISEFLSTLGACRNNIYDNADLAYNQDEGSILRRLLSVFSLRPIIIHTKPINSIASFVSSPYGASMNMGMEQTIFPFNTQPVYTVTSIPMITLQIPSPNTATDERIDLRDAATQTIWINENKTIVPKEQSIIYSKEVLIFYINRRVQKIQIRTFSNPLTFSQLPLTMSGFERLNDFPIDFPERMTLDRSREIYLLRSVVAVTQTEILQGDKSSHIITGCTGLIMKHRDINMSVYDPQYFLYDPFGASLPVPHPNNPNSGFITNKPITRIDASFTTSANYQLGLPANPSFFDRASRSGSIFIYAKPNGYNPHEIITI